MLFKKLHLVAFAALEVATAIPLTARQSTGADSCPFEPLNETTWVNLDMDKFMTDAAKNLTTSNVQGFASSLGAPNFFCGLDQFCNAGQPCLPVDVPAWYGLIAIQNYNNYMNSLNTAITFASSIMSLDMPAIIKDLWPAADDSTTSAKELTSIISLGLSVIPFTGTLSTVAGVAKGVNSFVGTQLQPATAPDLFVKWSDLASSISTAVQAYQSAVSKSLDDTINAGLDDSKTGVNLMLSGGGFLGVSHNFTQTDMQSEITDNLKLRSMALALQGLKAYIYRATGDCFNANNDPYKFCATINGTKWEYFLMVGDDFAQDVGTKLLGYGLKPEVFLQGPADCLDKYGVQLFTPAMLTSNECVFNLPVCTPGSTDNIVGSIHETCQKLGLDV
ncbi:hypothetical protein DL95DRAFT_439618 [Leptodontidium sp. 2 PMI_412]|nr:hypothetical protein DL95DRAFT_439618 [Leptodontidium sp. 2 PMI_412]